MKNAFTLALVTSGIFLTGCASSDIHEADRALESNLRTAINERHVDIDVHHGVVKLEGHVRTQNDRQRIEEVVRRTPGVVAVKDELKVSLPAPGVYGGFPSVPVYSAPPPEVVPSAPVVSLPAPVLIPDYPKLKVQALTEEDQPAADRIARELQAHAVPSSALEDATISVRNGKVSLKGVVDREAHDALIQAIQRAGGVQGIYDQMELR